MPDVILIRHCQAHGQRPDAPLTEIGLRQAVVLRDFLAQHPIDLVASSEYCRARQTAEPLADALGLDVRVDARLNERTISADPVSHWREIVRGSFGDPDLRAPGGESAREVLARAWSALDELLSDGHRMPALVSHGNWISLVLHSMDRAFGYEEWEDMSNPDVYLIHGLDSGAARYQRLWE